MLRSLKAFYVVAGSVVHDHIKQMEKQLFSTFVECAWGIQGIYPRLTISLAIAIALEMREHSMIEYCSFYIFLCGDNLSIVFFNPLNKYFCLHIYIGLLPETLID